MNKHKQSLARCIDLAARVIGVLEVSAVLSELRTSDSTAVAENGLVDLVDLHGC